MADERILTLVQEENHLAFNQLVEGGAAIDLSNAHLRSYDLRKFKLRNADLTGAYLRSTDLRGVDLSEAKLEGASLKDAKVSGVAFPYEVSAEELSLSLMHGTRLRTIH